MEFIEAIKRPFSDIKKWLIGCVLSIIPIVNFFSLGYQLEVGRLSLKKNRSLPEWEDWGDLFVKGLLWFVLAFVYMLPAAIIGVIGIAIGATAFVAALAGGSESSVTMLSALLGLIAAYLLPSAIFNWLKEGKFGAGFNFGAVLKRALTGSYFVAWLVSMVIWVVLALILSFIPLIGRPIAAFTAGIIMMTLIGEAVASMR